MRPTVALDVETTIKNKGHPFTLSNRLVLGGYYDGSTYTYFEGGFVSDRDRVQKMVDGVERLILFNGKFDLHWLRRIGVRIPPDLKIWDCQLAEFYFSNQSWKFPDLDTACANRGLGHKIDVVKNEYWDKGIDTDKIPRPVLQEYLQEDLRLTYELAQIQLGLALGEEKGKLNLLKVANADLLVLEEMEWNGILYDKAASLRLARDISNKIERIDIDIVGEHTGVSFNPSSNDHKSLLLYGGTLMVDDRVPIGVYKSGQRVGEPRYKVVTREYVFPRLVEPLKGTELSKKGFYSTDVQTLKALKATGEAKRLISLLIERSRIEKIRSTYLEGLPNRMDEMGWIDNVLHGQFNQCVAVTGRLASAKPNLQNLADVAKQLCVSRYV